MALSILLVLILVPGWSGPPRLPLIARDVTVTARAFVPPGGWPRRIGALEPIGAVELRADDPAFGGFSAIALRDGQATLLSDGGNVVRLAIRRGRLRTLGSDVVRQGPGRGWSKENRDSESLAVSPDGRHMWIGYERANAIWRYSGDLKQAEAWQAPTAMRGWGANSGPESLVRLRDGRFLVFCEGWRGQRGSRPALIFDGDPALPASAVARFAYLPPDGFAPSDAAELPGGDVLVLTRRFAYPFRFTSKLVRIPRAAIRPGAIVDGRVIATLGPAIGDENAEGLAIVHDQGATMLWIVTDNDNSPFRRTILAKFRLR